MNNVLFVPVFVILFIKINFVYLSPIVGGSVPTNHGTCVCPENITKIFFVFKKADQIFSSRQMISHSRYHCRSETIPRLQLMMVAQRWTVRACRVISTFAVELS